MGRTGSDSEQSSSAAEPDPAPPGPAPPSEARLLAVLVAVQLVTVVDLTMLLPLGPDLLAPLGLDAARLPLLIAAGTLSAALAGLLGGGWLECAPRRRTMVGLLLALAAAALVAASAGGWRAVLVARLCAGAAGGQAAALSLVVLSEAVPESRRGRAVGAMMAANGLAAIGGVPLGLWLAEELGWRAAFGLIALGATLAALLAARALSPAPGRPTLRGSIFSPLAQPAPRRALALSFLVAASAFLLNPNLSAFVQHNLGFPRENLSGLYAVAGAVALVTTQLTGRAVDRWGALQVGSAAAAVFCTVVLCVVVAEGAMPVSLGFIALLASLQSRNVSVRALATRVPPPEERGRFMSLWSAAQQFGAAAGALVSAAMLTAEASGRLIGLPGVGLLAVVLALCALPLLAAVQRAVVDRCSGEGMS